MHHLYFIRSRTAIEDENYYDSKTDVWVFGDQKGYDYFASRLSLAKSAKQPVRLTDIVQIENSMRAVILPPRKLFGNRPRLKICERIIFERRKPAMELIICGNRAAYKRLANLVRSLALNRGPPLLDHTHVDDWHDAWVAKRSVSLNLRAPLSKWSRSALDYYVHSIYGPNAHRLPADISYLKPWPYKCPDADHPYLQP